MLSHSVHPIVPVARPHERKTMLARGKTAVQRTCTMFKQCCADLRHSRLEVGLVLTFGERSAFQKRNNLVHHGHVPGGFHVLCDGVWQPEQIVGNTRTDPASRGWMPPVLDVALAELARRCAQ